MDSQQLMQSEWLSAAGNLFTGIACLTIAALVYWISRQSKFRFNYALVGFSLFAGFRAFAYFLEAYAAWHPIQGLVSIVDFSIGFFILAVAVWTWVRRRAIIEVVSFDVLSEERGNKLEALAMDLEQKVERRTLKIEKMRKESQRFGEQLVVLMDALPSAVTLIDRERRYEIINAAAIDYLGMSKQEIVGQSVREVIGEASYNTIHSQLDETFSTGKSVEFRAQFDTNRARFGRRDLRCIFTPIFDEQGKVAHVVTLTTDITATTAAENYLAEARNKAEEANMAKTQFLANMSHEIRTPLAAISGFSELLLNSELAFDEVENAVLSIRRNSYHLANLVNEILDLSKIEAGKLEVERLCFEPQEIFDYVTSVLSFAATEKGITLNVVPDPNMPKYITTDPTRLRQILVNIIGNAVKFTESGAVTVTIRHVPKDLGATEIQFSVADTGIGIPVERQAKLFIPFSQSDSSTTRRFGGTGLGLALSRKLARALGGDVVLVRSSPEQGSEFLVTIDGGALSDRTTPNESEDAEHSGHSSNGYSSSLNGVKILAVDDSPDNRDLIRAYLRPSGALVEFAQNGHEGVDLALQREYDVVLMDIQMPELDGHTATRRLRNAGYRKPIIALTAHAFKEDRHLAFASGFDDHLTKPIERSSLYNAIRHFVHKGDETAARTSI